MQRSAQGDKGAFKKREAIHSLSRTDHCKNKRSVALYKVNHCDLFVSCLIADPGAPTDLMLDN